MIYVLDVCTGYGGLSEGLRIALDGRVRCVGYVEREGYAAANIVAKIQRDALDPAPVWDDITTFDGKPYRGKVDCITAGYPCQPFSNAGLRRGLDDERHIWPEIARVISEIEPPLLFIENVPNHLRIGFAEVVESLLEMGFVVAPGLFEAAEVGAPHYRKRLFMLAYTPDLGYERLRRTRRWWAGFANEGVSLGHAASDDERRQRAGEGRSQIENRGSGGMLADADDGALPLAWRRSGGRSGPRSTGQAMADANDDGQQQSCEPEREGGRRIADGRARLADTEQFRCNTGLLADGTGSEVEFSGCGSCGKLWKDDTTGIPTFPPWYSDTIGWESIWEQVVESALEPAIYGMADGDPHRVDRLRLAGNGVVPLQAAHAFGLLAASVVDDE